MVDIHQRDIPNENQFDAIREKAEREQLQVEGESREATRGPGSVGGRSGNGQMKPHVTGQASGRSNDADPSIVPEAIDADLQSDRDTQSGGTAIDREARVEERKQRESGQGRSGHQGEGMDPPPGAPTRGS
ncbi:hypothetical protein [Dyella sp.]|jgi:hypothetical protein|uniref:hypothetical protein n=1 Tax=Dyella sp. TaxID=1869338 RepID=UPI002D7A3DC5|nr:hypothetical protein [Dyella sp.]HET6432551.1 hypothetical protein [Dyella sp.]